MQPTDVFCSWGFVEVIPNRVVILAQTDELSSDIDLKRAEEAKIRAEKMLNSKDPCVDHSAAGIAMMRLSAASMPQIIAPDIENNPYFSIAFCRI